MNSTNGKPANYDWAKDIPCKNIIIYGYCKHEDKCAFKHDIENNNSTSEQREAAAQSAAPQSATPVPPAVPAAPVANGGQSQLSPVAAKIAAAPIFTPTSQQSTRPNTAASSSTIGSELNNSQLPKKKFNFDSPVFTPNTSTTNAGQDSGAQPITSATSASYTQNNTSPLAASAVTANTNNNMGASAKFSSPQVSSVSAFIPESMQQAQQGLQKFKIDTPSFTPSDYQGPPMTSAPSATNANMQHMMRASQTQSPIQIPQSIPLHQHPQQQQQQQQLHQFQPPPTHLTPSHSSLQIAQSAAVSAIHQQQQGQTPSGAGIGANDPFYQQQISQAATAAAVIAAATTSAPQYPLQYHLYAQLPPPHFKMPIAPYERTLSNLFIPNDIRETLQRQNEASNQILPHSNLPDHVNAYHSLTPIDNSFEYGSVSKAFGLQNTLFKVQSSIDGKLYCMRKLLISEDIEVNDASILQFKKWSKIFCANTVKLVEAFTSMAFNDNSLFLVYDYYPASATLMEAHFQNFMGRTPVVITEPLLWGYILQISNAISQVHSKDLAIKTWDLSKIIVTGHDHRIRFSGCAVDDILNHNNREEGYTVKDDQADDFNKFGELIFQLSYTTLPPHQVATIKDLPRQEIIERFHNFSFEFKEILRLLNSGSCDLAQLQQKLAPKLVQQMDGLQNSIDYHERVLSNELENGRLFRLLAKLNFICDRPEFLKDESWSETGGRYPIKLFRDYCFHQSNEFGKPALDLVHVLSCLNKLDCGIEERLLLVSSDEKSCLIISYKELKDLIETSFRELNNA